MSTTATVVVAYAVALVVVAVVVVVRRRLPPRDADPLFILGIVIAGTGAALMEAAGAQMAPMAAFGIVLIAVGGWTSRNRAHHR